MNPKKQWQAKWTKAKPFQRPRSRIATNTSRLGSLSSEASVASSLSPSSQHSDYTEEDEEVAVINMSNHTAINNEDEEFDTAQDLRITKPNKGDTDAWKHANLGLKTLETWAKIKSQQSRWNQLLLVTGGGIPMKSQPPAGGYLALRQHLEARKKSLDHLAMMQRESSTREESATYDKYNSFLDRPNSSDAAARLVAAAVGTFSYESESPKYFQTQESNTQCPEQSFIRPPPPLVEIHTQNYKVQCR